MRMLIFPDTDTGMPILVSCIIPDALTVIYVKIIERGLYLLVFNLIFLFFSFSFCYLLFLEQLGLELERSVTLSHQSQSDGVVTILIMRLGRIE